MALFRCASGSSGASADFVYIAKISAANKGNKITTGWKPTKIMWIFPNYRSGQQTLAFYYDEASAATTVDMAYNGSIQTAAFNVSSLFNIESDGITFIHPSYLEYVSDSWVMLGR